MILFDSQSNINGLNTIISLLNKHLQFNESKVKILFSILNPANEPS